MNIGARIIKTGLSVALAIFLTELLGFQPITIAAVAAVLAIQPSVMRSWKYLKDVTIGNAIGATFATGSFYLFGAEPINVGLVVVVTIAANLALGLKKTVNLAVLTSITILCSTEMSDLPAWGIALNRFTLIGVGILSAILINIMILPPKHSERLYGKVKNINNKLNTYLRALPRKEMKVKICRSERKTLEKELAGAAELFDLLNEERKRFWIKDRRSFVRNVVVNRQMVKVIKKELNLFEKIEKQYNTLSDITDKETDRINELISELLFYKETVYLVYEGKITAQQLNRENKRSKIMEKSNLVIKDIMGHFTPEDEELWSKLFLIIGAIVEVESELMTLEKLVIRYKESSGKRNKKKRVKKNA